MKTEKEAIQDTIEYLKNTEPKCIYCNQCRYYLNEIQCQQEQQNIKDKHEFNKKWIRECYRVLKDEGTIWISGTLHNIYSIGMALEEEGFKIINNITWKKLNPPPNISCRAFVHSTETVLWATRFSISSFSAEARVEMRRQRAAT